MHPFAWWTLPVIAEGAVIFATIISSSLDRAHPSLGALVFGVGGTLVCAFFALGCYVFAG
jgi:hypothetical protein